MVQGRGVIAEGQLLPDVQKQLGVAASAEECVAHQQRRRVAAAAGEAHAQLALGHVQLLHHRADLLPGRVVLGDGHILNVLSGQCGKGGAQGPHHPVLIGAAAVKQLQPGGGDQLAVLCIQLPQLQLFRSLLAAQAADAVGLSRAHLPQEAAVGIVPLVVDEAADGVDQVRLFTLKVGGHEPSPLRGGVADQLAQQVRHRLQQFFAAGGEAVVDKAGHKAHALILAFLADRVVDAGAIQPVQSGGQTPHVGIGHGATPQHSGQQGVSGGRLLPDGHGKLGG